MAATTKKAKVPAAPKFKLGQRVKWYDKAAGREVVRTIYGVVASLSDATSAAGRLVGIEREDGAGTISDFESGFDPARTTPLDSALWHLKAARNDMAKRIEAATESLAKAAAAVAAQAADHMAGLGETFGRNIEDTMRASRLIQLMQPALSFMESEIPADATAPVIRRAADQLVEEGNTWLRRLVSDDAFRHNCTAEYVSIRNRMDVAAMQDAYAVLSSTVCNLQHAANDLDDATAGRDEWQDHPGIKSLPGARGW